MVSLESQLSKLTPPRLPKVLERHRLFRCLNFSVKKRAVIWICAPPGFGKTTLVASYLRKKKVSFLWYQVDGRDKDPATFFHYFNQAITKYSPRSHKRLPQYTPELLPGLLPFTHRFFEQVFTQLKSRTIIVLDNVQEASNQSRFGEILQVCLSTLPPDKVVFLISRELPPPELTRFQANQQLEILGEEQLRLTPEETEAICHLYASAYKWRLTKTFLSDIHDKIQGWVAGLMLFLEQERVGGLTRNVESHDAEPTFLFQYLAQEVLGNLPNQMREFLMKTCFLPSMNEGMARHLTGLKTAGTLAEELYRSRYFTERRQETEIAYQYHPLFRDFLIQQAKHSFSPTKLHMVQRKATQVLEANGRIEEAVTVALQNGVHGSTLIQLLLNHALTFVKQGRVQTLEQWLRQVPQEMMESHPKLIYWMATCRLPFDPREAQTLYEKAFQALRKQKDYLGALKAWCGIIESIFFLCDDFQQFNGWINEVEPLLQRIHTFPNIETEARLATAVVCAHIWVRPAPSFIQPWLNRATTLILTIQDPMQAMLIGHQLILYHFWYGQPHKAKNILGTLQRMASHVQQNPWAKHLFCMAEGFHALNAGDVAELKACIARGITNSEEHGISAWMFNFEGLKIYSAMFENDFAQAEQCQQLLDQFVDQAPNLTAGHHDYVGSVANLVEWG